MGHVDVTRLRRVRAETWMTVVLVCVALAGVTSALVGVWTLYGRGWALLVGGITATVFALLFDPLPQKREGGRK